MSPNNVLNVRELEALLLVIASAIILVLSLIGVCVAHLYDVNEKLLKEILAELRKK